MENKIIIYTDGGSRGNPGPSAIGVYIDSFNKKYKEFIGEGTNNNAEYKAIIFSLKIVRQLLGKKKAKETEIEINSDSELVVKQLNGEYKIKVDSLVPLFMEIWNLKQDFKRVNFKNVLREENKIADRLVNEALDENIKNKLFR